MNDRNSGGTKERCAERVVGVSPSVSGCLHSTTDFSEKETNLFYFQLRMSLFMKTTISFIRILTLENTILGKPLREIHEM
jgi:hypothetical protein